MGGDDGGAGGCSHDPVAAPQRLQSKVFWLLGRSARIAQRETTAELAEVGLRRGYYGVLGTLVEFGPTTQADLCRRLGVDRSDMVAIVTGLADSDLVTREVDPADRRRNIVTVTPAGRRRLAKFDRAIAKAEAEFLAELSSEDEQALRRILTRLAQL